MDAKIIIILGLPTVLLLIAGLVSPGWIRAGSFSSGLFYACSEGSCQSYDSFLDQTSSLHLTLGMLEVQIEATIGAVAGVLGLILAFVFVRQGSNGNYTVLALGSIFFLAAGILSWIPTWRFISVYTNAKIGPLLDTPYSLIVTGLGASLAIIVANIAFKMSCERRTPNPGIVLQQPHPKQGVVQPAVTGYPAQGHDNQNVGKY
ncbi:hypothetical protein ScPMuIL_005020 [Solemya velum]